MSNMQTIDLGTPIWSRFHLVHGLVVIGSSEAEGGFDLAPKHLAMPLSWQKDYGFVCTPAHRTYSNIQRSEVFTVSYPRPSDVVVASLAASPRGDDGDKPGLTSLPTVAAEHVDGVLLADAYLHLECRLTRIIDGFAENSLICGEIVACRVATEALRDGDRDDADVIREAPLLAYLHPWRWATVDTSIGFPLPDGFRR
jgi:flavin reductase (DIM6/NTAB) family NADH-FMN oxidoreductase RutF